MMLHDRMAADKDGPQGWTLALAHARRRGAAIGVVVEQGKRLGFPDQTLV